MSDSSFSALICSLTARRIAVVDSLASTGSSNTPFLISARVSSSSVRIDSRSGACPRSRRRSASSPTRSTSVIAMRILSVDSSVRPSALCMALADQILEGVHDALEVLRLLDQPDGQVLERGLPLERVLEIALGRAQEIRRAGQQPAVLVELGGDRGHLAQRVGRQLGQAGRVLVDKARRAGEGLRRLFRASQRSSACCRSAARRHWPGSVRRPSISSLSCELDAVRLSIRPLTPSERLLRAPSTADERLGGAVGERVDQRRVLGAQPIGGSGW